MRLSPPNDLSVNGVESSHNCAMEPSRGVPRRRAGGRDCEGLTDDTTAAGGGRVEPVVSERRLDLVRVAVPVGIVVIGGALGFWLAASNGIHSVDDIVGAPLLGIVL